MNKLLEIKVTYTDQTVKLYEDCYLKGSSQVVDLQEGDDVWFTFNKEHLQGNVIIMYQPVKLSENTTIYAKRHYIKQDNFKVPIPLTNLLDMGIEVEIK